MTYFRPLSGKNFPVGVADVSGVGVFGLVSRSIDLHLVLFMDLKKKKVN